MDQQEMLAYIGGVMDGDGSFGITRRKGKKGQSALFSPIIQFGSLNQFSVELMKNLFGGYVILQKAHTKKDGSFRRDFYHWRLGNNGSCLPFLNTIIPYLEVKKERAIFLRDYILQNPFHRGSKKLSEEILLLREKSYLKMKDFNDNKLAKESLIKSCRVINNDKFSWAYIAGLIDTDGSFSIKREVPAGDRISLKHTPQVLLSMTDLAGINKIRKTFPFGNVSIINAKSCKTGNCYRWALYSKNDVSVFLENVIPFLKQKINQALVLKKFCDNVDNTSHRRSGISSNEIDFREDCYNNLVNLNKYGVYKPSLIDLEAREAGDRAEGESHGERLSEMASKEDAIV